MIKKFAYMMLFTMLLFSLSACGGGGDSHSEDPLAAAQREFNYEVDNLTRMQEDLSMTISRAEDLLGTVTETDVTDVTVLNDLQTALENSKNAPKPTVPEMKSTPEEIQQQRENLSEQTNTISNFYYDLQSAVSRVEESQEAKRVEFENMDAFDAARSMGYEVEELSASALSKYYYVSFSYNGASFLISSANEPSGDILFYGKKMETKDLVMGTFGFTTFYFSDGGNVSRDSSGHWTFSTEQKEQLLNLLSNFKKSGPSSFVDALSPISSSYLSPEMSALVKEFGLSVAYQEISGGYRFMVSDGENLAWFAAVYSDADFRPSDNASGLNTYKSDANEYRTSGFLSSSFPTDYVDSSGHLVSEPERADQLRSFFDGTKQRPLLDIEPASQDEDIVLYLEGYGYRGAEPFSGATGPMISWELNGKYNRLTGTWSTVRTMNVCGSIDEMNEAFEIYADDTLVYTSPILSEIDTSVDIDIPINNCQKLKMVFTSSAGFGVVGDVTLYK